MIKERPLTDILENDAFRWNPDASLAFRNLKKAITNTLILILPDFSKPFLLDIDACSSRIGEH